MILSYDRLIGPYGICIGPDGTLYFADNFAVKMLSASGIVSVYAGTVGTYGAYASSNGDGSAATSATFYSNPIYLWMDTSGNLYINDNGNSVIRKVSATTHIISTYAGMCIHLPCTYFCGPSSLFVYLMHTTHILSNSFFVLITGSYATTSYGSNGNAATSVALKTPFGIGGDSSGNVYITEFGSSHTIVRVVQPSGNIYAFAGTGSQGKSGDLGPATSASLEGPTALCVDAYNNVYFADAGSSWDVVKKVFVSPAGTTLTPVTASTSAPHFSPTSQPTRQPTRQPTNRPSHHPSTQPTTQPTNPTSQPTRQPTLKPSNRPTIQPSRQPSARPSHHPSCQPTRQPTRQPTSQPTRHPTRQPTSQPTR